MMATAGKHKNKELQQLSCNRASVTLLRLKMTFCTGVKMRCQSTS